MNEKSGWCSIQDLTAAGKVADPDQNFEKLKYNVKTSKFVHISLLI